MKTESYGRAVFGTGNGMVVARAIVCLVILLPLNVARVMSQEAKEASSEGPKGIELFDGKSLQGWEKTDFYKPGEVKVEDGNIILKVSPASAGMTGITTTRKDLPKVDYELSYEAMRLEGMDFFAAATFPVGKSFATLVNGGWGGSVTGISCLDGSDASENESSTYVKYVDKTWYRFRVRVTDQRIRCWLEDEQIVDVDYQNRHVGTRLEVHANEPLGFATWEAGSALRNITIRQLTKEEITETNKANEP